MLKLCTSSWNVSGHRPLLPPSNGVERWPGCLFVDAVFISFYVCVLLKAGPLNCTFPQTQMAWAHCISLTLQFCSSRTGEAHFKRYKVLKTTKKKSLKKLQKKNKTRKREKATFQDLQSCSTQAKITIACFCNCLDPSSDRPNSRGPPSILY